MKSQQEISDKLNQIIADEPNKWLEEADYRFENKAWLKKSQAIALKILRHIRANGISQKDLAERLNVSPQQVNKWIKGSENFTLETISRIEDAMDIRLISLSATPKNNENVIAFKKEMPFGYDKNAFYTNYSDTETKIISIKPYNNNQEYTFNQKTG